MQTGSFIRRASSTKISSSDLHSAIRTTFWLLITTLPAIVGSAQIWLSSGHEAAGNTMSASCALGVMKRSAQTRKSSFMSAL